MNTSDFNYNLPPELIAQEPVHPRDHSRLFVVDKEKQTIEHRHFYDIIDFFKKGDLIVWNNSKVFKARLYGKLLSKDGEPLFEHNKKVEIFLVRPMENEGVWQVLAKPGRHVRPGTKGRFASDFFCEVMVKEPTGKILVQFPDDEDTELAAIFGETMAIEPNKKYLCVREIKSAETELTDPIEPIDQIEYVSDIDPSEWHSLLTPAGNNENNETIATCLSILRGEEPSDN